MTRIYGISFSRYCLISWFPTQIRKCTRNILLGHSNGYSKSICPNEKNPEFTRKYCWSYSFSDTRRSNTSIQPVIQCLKKKISSQSPPVFLQLIVVSVNSWLHHLLKLYHYFQIQDYFSCPNYCFPFNKSYQSFLNGLQPWLRPTHQVLLPQLSFQKIILVNRWFFHHYLFKLKVFSIKPFLHLLYRLNLHVVWLHSITLYLNRTCIILQAQWWFDRCYCHWLNNMSMKVENQVSYFIPF